MVSATVDNGTKAVTLKTKAGRQLRPLSLGTEFAFQPESSNALLLGSWKMAMEDGSGLERGYHLPDFDDTLWLDVSKGAWEMQLGRERDNPTYPVSLWYRTWFDAGFIPNDLRLVIDGFSGISYRLFVNAEEVSDRGVRSALDAEMREIAIRQNAKPGRNCLAVMLVVKKRTDGILDPLKILGDFALRKENKSYTIIRRTPTLRVGDWTKQGYPFYSGTGAYSTQIDVPAVYAGGAMFLEVDCGEDVLEVSVNGGEGRVVPWHPFRINVSDQIRTGRNTIELKVTNTLINILEGVQKKSGIASAPKLVRCHRYALEVGSRHHGQQKVKRAEYSPSG